MKGKLIVIEGLDGSGKSTQVNLLKNKLEAQGIKNKFIHFPMLNKGIYGTLIAEFLRGEYGSVDVVHPKLVALLFANDRKEHIHIIEEWLNEGYFVLADRYIYSNIAFQCAKMNGETAKEKLRDWILNFEYQTNMLPRPYKSFYLDVPFSFIKKSLSEKRTGEDRKYLMGKKDIHEDSINLQNRVLSEYKKIVTEYDSFTNITCFNSDNSMLNPVEINNKILKALNFEKVLIQ